MRWDASGEPKANGGDRRRVGSTLLTVIWGLRALR